MNDKLSQIFLRTPFWLNNREIGVIEQALGSHQCVKSLNEKQQQKVAALLFSITYADKWAARRRTWLARGLQRLASWLIPLKSQKNLSKRKICKIIGKDPASVPAVIDHLVNRIGLDKPLPLIFTEYHALPPGLTPQQKSNAPQIPIKKSFFWGDALNVSDYVADSLEAYQYVSAE